VPIRDTGVTSLSGKVYNGTVQVAILARVFGAFPDDPESGGTPEGGAEYRASGNLSRSPESQPSAAGQRRGPSAVQQGLVQAGPSIPPRPQERPGATLSL
jgi:hypothetical protein